MIDDDDEYGAVGEMRIGRGKGSTQKICPSATLFTIFSLAFTWART
jgi:hypothetical protein